jgi:hypothetical protein
VVTVLVPICNIRLESSLKWKNDGFIFPCFSFAAGHAWIGWPAFFFDGGAARGWPNRWWLDGQACRFSRFHSEETGEEACAEACFKSSANGEETRPGKQEIHKTLSEDRQKGQKAT